MDPRSAVGENGADADSDSDGLNSLQEFLLGTSPQDTGSRFSVASSVLPGGKVRISFGAVPGRSYTVEYRDGLTGGAWQVVQKLIAPANANLLSVEDVPTKIPRFYRVASP